MTRGWGLGVRDSGMDGSLLVPSPQPPAPATGGSDMAEIGVGLVGYKFMGRAHSNAYRQVSHFFDVDPVPRMVALCGRDEAAVKEAAAKLGWESYETDYRKLVARDDVGLVDVSTIGNTHYEIVLAALAQGKHVYCEKPLANSLSEAR